MKRCSRCKDPKPDEAFYKNDRYRDGLSSCCRECNRTAAIKRNESLGREAQNEYQADYRKRFPEKYRAHKQLQLEREKRARDEAKVQRMQVSTI